MKTKETSTKYSGCKTPDDESTREQALAWWNNLSDISIQMPSKSHLCKKYHSNRRIHRSLTGREIEEIWLKETQQCLKYDNPRSCENNECRVLNKCNGEFKPNQKQYSQEEVDELLDRQAAEATHQTIKAMKALNQKQFKQFDESLFKSYIDKMPESESLNIIKIIYETKLPDCKFKEHLNKWFKL